MSEHNAVIDLDSKLRRRTDLLTTSLAKDAVIMDILSGSYFGFNKVAAEIWSLLEKETTLRDICVHLQSRYKVAPEVGEADVRGLLNRLLGEGLITSGPAAV